MTVADIQQWLWKSRKWIAVFVAAALLLCFAYIGFKQTYAAEVYIKYLGEDAEDGLAPNGSVLNPYEIADPFVVSKALEQLGMSDMKAANICRNITVTPVVSIAEEEKYASWVNSFSSYNETEEEKPHAVYYCVQFRTGEGAEFAQNFLGALVRQYRDYYTKTYATTNALVVLEENMLLRGDYFEAVQSLQGRVEDNIDYLDMIVTDDWNYRSPITGYSIRDLIDEHSLFLQTKIAPLGKYVLEHGFSKDANTLTASLKTKIDNAQMDSEKAAQEAGTQLQLMEVYAEKNYEYLWEVSGEDNSSQVRENAERDDYYNNVKTTYDQMMQDYVDYAAKSKDLLIDKAYNEIYLGSFTASSVNSDYLDSLIPQIYDEYAALHALTEDTLEGYNEYKASRYILQASGVSVKETLPVLLYCAVTLVVALGISMGGVVFVELKRKKVI